MPSIRQIYMRDWGIRGVGADNHRRNKTDAAQHGLAQPDGLCLSDVQSRHRRVLHAAPWISDDSAWPWAV